MQSAAELVALVRKLAPGVQGAQDDLDAGKAKGDEDVPADANSGRA